MPKYIDADALLREAKRLSGPQTGDGWDNWGVYALIERQPAADVEPKMKWIPVTERLPEEKISPMTMDYTEYPCVFDGRDGQREVRYYKFGKGHFWHGSGCIDEYVTHWAEPMPLPEPPKEEEDGAID